MTVGVANPSYPNPCALLSPKYRQEAEGCKRQHHAPSGPLHKVLHRICNEHNSTAAASCWGKHSSKEPKATVHLDQSIIGIQAEKKGIPNAKKDGKAYKFTM